MALAILVMSPPAFAVDWYAQYNAKYPSGVTPVANGTGLGWGESYTIRGFISMYRAAKARGESAAEQQKFLAWIVQHCDNIVDKAMRASSAIVLEGHGFAPVGMFVRMVFQDPALYEAYHVQANKYLTYLEGTIVPTWRDFDYWNWPHNQYTSLGTLLVQLAQVSRSPHYQAPDYTTPDTTLAAYYQATVTDMATKYFADLGWVFEGGATKWWQLPFDGHSGLCYVPEFDAYVWRYMDDPDPTPRPEDDHSNLEVEFMLEVVHDPVFCTLYPASVPPRVARTMTRFMWANDDESNPVFHTHIVEPTWNYGSLAGSFLNRWVWLAEWDPKVATLCSNYCEKTPSMCMGEGMAHLAAWQAGLHVRDEPLCGGDAGVGTDGSTSDGSAPDSDGGQTGDGPFDGPAGSSDGGTSGTTTGSCGCRSANVHPSSGTLLLAAAMVLAPWARQRARPRIAGPRRSPR
jgi:MYXO-CTERM domain-containing protein